MGMVTVGMNYEVIEGKGDAFESMFKKVLSVMAEMDGHTDSHLYTDVFNKNSYLIVSQWSNQDAYDAFIASDKFKKVVDWGKEQILAGRPKHEVYGREDKDEAKCPVH
jgi:heme-degrading monooxygenase HmoA